MSDSTAVSSFNLGHWFNVAIITNTVALDATFGIKVSNAFVDKDGNVITGNFFLNILDPSSKKVERIYVPASGVSSDGLTIGVETTGEVQRGLKPTGMDITDGSDTYAFKLRTGMIVAATVDPIILTEFQQALLGNIGSGLKLNARPSYMGVGIHSDRVFADATARDAAITSPTNGDRCYNTAAGVFQKYQGGAWTDDATGTTANASVTVAGKVEISTDAEIRSKTGTGGSGAIVVIPASSLVIFRDNRIVLKDSTELTISSGAITVTQPYHSIDTESDASGDDLITITAAVGAGEMIYVRLANSARMINFKDGDGNLIIPGGDYTLADPDEILCFIQDGTNWRLVGPRGAVVGEMKIWTTATPPTGWTLCDGSVPDASTNPEFQNLFDAIGTTYGGSDNSDFVVPDMRGRLPLGKDNMGGTPANRVTDANADSLAGAVGSETHTLTEAQMPPHNHTVDVVTDTNSSVKIKATTGSNVFGQVTTSSTGGGDPHANLQPTLTVNYIIRI